MSTYGGSNIVTSGLVLNLDAANVRSYPGTGTNWFDRSGNGNNGSLLNSPSFNSSNGGNIVFDGANNYVSCGNSSSLQLTEGTISAWVKTTSPGSSFRSIIAKQNNYGLFLQNSILTTYDWGNNATRTTSINIADGTWKNTVMTFTTNTGTPSNNAIIYLNGINIITTTIKLLDNTVVVEIARGGTITGGNTQYLNGSIAQTQIYNRALSAAEVLQNYNAVKSRFNL